MTLFLALIFFCCLFLLLKRGLDYKISNYTRNCSHCKDSTEKPTSKDRAAGGTRWEATEAAVTDGDRKLSYPTGGALTLAQVRLVTTLAGSLSVFRFRFYMAITISSS